MPSKRLFQKICIKPSKKRYRLPYPRSSLQFVMFIDPHVTNRSRPLNLPVTSWSGQISQDNVLYTAPYRRRTYGFLVCITDQSFAWWPEVLLSRASVQVDTIDLNRDLSCRKESWIWFLAYLHVVLVKITEGEITYVTPSPLPRGLNQHE